MKKSDIPTHLHDFDALFRTMINNHPAYRVWDNFLELAVCGLAYGTMQDTQENISKTYTNAEIGTFWEMFKTMSKIYAGKKDDWIDPLGEYYEYLSSKGHKQDFGQFFTPNSICKLMTNMTMVPSRTNCLITDPACGSGRLLLSYNSQSPGNYFVASDLDRTCVLMTAVNMCLHGATGEVVWKDALDNDDFRLCYRFGGIVALGKYIPIISQVQREDSFLETGKPAPAPTLPFQSLMGILMGLV